MKYNPNLQIVNTSNNSYFGKTILFIIVSVAFFIAFKSVLPKRLFPEQVLAANNIVVDSMMINAINDTQDVDSVNTDSINETNIAIDHSIDPTVSADGYKNIESFYAKLYKLEKEKIGKVRIGYFGDSMNDGDYIVQDVRSLFQEAYGGEGVGFVAISSLSALSRGSVSHQYSKNWTVQSFLKVKKPAYPFGIDGQVFTGKSTSAVYWVKYKAQAQKHSTMLNNPVLFYGKSNNESAYIDVKADKDSIYTKTLSPNSLLNTVSLTPGSVKSMQVDFHKIDSIPIYGFNFDDGKGVHVDNFSMRGNSGLPLSILNPSLMNAFDKVLNYDLIILQYGTNVLGYGSLNYNWYDKSMTTVVKHLRQCFPNSDILIISTADKASKIDQVMQTDLAVVPLATTQKNYARKTGAGFISLYNLMGGKGSMVKWVDESKLANKDYTHFNTAGSKKVAKLIYDEINKGYVKYKMSKE